MTSVSRTPGNSTDNSGDTRGIPSLEDDVAVVIETPDEQRKREQERKREKQRERNKLLQAHPELMTPDEAAHARWKVEQAAAIAERQAEKLRQRVAEALAKAARIREGAPDDSGTEAPRIGVTVGGPPRIPDVTDKSPLDAALAYAAAGMYVLPTDPGDIKNPGSIVKGHWQDQSSRDPAQIRRWWTNHPNAGIALHCGKSGLIAFDLDIDSIDTIEADGRKDIADALRDCPTIHLTRREGDRGHYLYLMPDGQQYGNSAGAFMRWGQVRGQNGVIILAPTPHPDAETKGGHYHWKRAS